MSEKTESPTSRRINEARDEGRVARSQEINAALALLVGTILLKGPGKTLVDNLCDLIRYSLVNLPTGELTPDNLQSIVYNHLSGVIPSLGGIMVGLLLTGVVATFAQTKFLWAKKKIGFDFNKLNPIPGFKRIFSSQGLIELLRALIKLVVIGITVYGFLKGKVPQLLDLARMDTTSGLTVWTSLAADLSMRVAEVYLVIAAIDYMYQRWQYDKSMKMTKEEVKEEMKQTEGDPLLKSRIRSQQRRMARMRMMSNVKKADVIITNPTHLAIAIQYDPKTMQAPIVLAKGADLIAKRIIAIGREHQVPVVQNIPLARAIYKTVAIEQEIPPELYVALAEVLSYVYRMRGHSPISATN